MSIVAESYLEMIEALRHAHAELLDAVDAELHRRNESLTAIQAIMLFHIGDQEVSPTALKQRGYYLGTNVSYNLRSLFEDGYLVSHRADEDRRCIFVALSDKGRALRAVLTELFERHLASMDSLGDFKSPSLALLTTGLKNLRRFWLEDRLYAISRMRTA